MTLHYIYVLRIRHVKSTSGLPRRQVLSLIDENHYAVAMAVPRAPHQGRSSWKKGLPGAARLKNTMKWWGIHQET
jgi:hypothetical protein